MSVSRIALVKPEKARGVEDLILRSAQMGQITEKVSRFLFGLEQPARKNAIFKIFCRCAGF